MVAPHAPSARAADADAPLPPEAPAGFRGLWRGDVPARPGLSPLRFTTTYVVAPARFEQLRQAAGEITGRPVAAGDTLTFVGRRFVAGATPGIRTEPQPEPAPEPEPDAQPVPGAEATEGQ